MRVFVCTVYKKILVLFFAQYLALSIRKYGAAGVYGAGGLHMLQFIISTLMLAYN